MNRPLLSLRFCLLVVALLAVCMTAGCNKGADDRLLGKWTFDHEYTVAHLPSQAAKVPATTPASPVAAKSTPSGTASMGAEINGMLNNEVKPMLDSLKPMLTEQLIAQMDGQTFTITPKLITDSTGKAQTYQVVERASANSWSVKTADGEIATYTIENSRLTFLTTGDVHFALYFKRAGL